MRLLVKISGLWAPTASHTEDDLHQFDQTIIFLKPARERPRNHFQYRSLAIDPNTG